MMKWGSFAAFFSMGGYAWYIWVSYGITIVLFCLEISILYFRMRHLLRPDSR